MQQVLIQKIVKERNKVVPALFKPVQFSILKKMEKGQKLNENEKRYLRGNIKRKLLALHELLVKQNNVDPLREFLQSIQSYYITGLEALKHNGFGWYYEPRIIEIINTKIEGRFSYKGKIIKLVRVKSIAKSKTKPDKENGLTYATNDQIIKDVAHTDNAYTEKVWKQMVSRYGKMFVTRVNKYKTRYS